MFTCFGLFAILRGKIARITLNTQAGGLPLNFVTGPQWHELPVRVIQGGKFPIDLAAKNTKHPPANERPKAPIGTRGTLAWVDKLRVFCG
jgi:hypothetical protein